MIHHLFSLLFTMTNNSVFSFWCFQWLFIWCQKQNKTKCRKIALFPKGDNGVNNDISIYVHVADYDKLPDDWSICKLLNHNCQSWWSKNEHHKEWVNINHPFISPFLSPLSSQPNFLSLPVIVFLWQSSWWFISTLTFLLPFATFHTNDFKMWWQCVQSLLIWLGFYKNDSWKKGKSCWSKIWLSRKWRPHHQSEDWCSQVMREKDSRLNNTFLFHYKTNNNDNQGNNVEDPTTISRRRIVLKTVMR